VVRQLSFKLPEIDREKIKEAVEAALEMSNEEMYDYELYNEMEMSESKYYRLKARAFYKLAFTLRSRCINNEFCTADL
jgi:hypothetical protein